MKNIDTDGSKPWKAFPYSLYVVRRNELINESLFPIALVAAAMQRIRDRISALEDRKRALLQDMISPATGEKESVDPK